MSADHFELAIFGDLKEDYIIAPDGSTFDGVLGGGAAHAAAGARVWNASVGLISRVGQNFPQNLLSTIVQEGIDIQGVRVLSEEYESHAFHAYYSSYEHHDSNPASHYLRVGRPIPKALVGKARTRQPRQLDTFGPLTLRPADVPADFRACKGAHLGPADFLAHVAVPARLGEMEISAITLAPSLEYMDPRMKSKLPTILSSVQAFIPNEKEARALYPASRMDLWEIAESLADMGVPLVVIKCGAGGQLLWDRQTGQRWLVPAYPARVVEVTGAGSAYCGGFLAGWVATQDPLESALQGSVSASLAIEGPGALFPLAAAPGLAQARLHALRPAVKRL